MKKTLIVLFILLTACTEIKLTNNSPNIKTDKDYNNKNGNDRCLKGRADKYANYHRLLFTTDNGYCLTECAYDSEVCFSIFTFTNTIHVYNGTSYGNRELHVLLCYEYGMDSDIMKIEDRSTKDLRKYLQYKGVLINSVSYLFYRDIMIFSIKYVKLMTAKDCEVFLKIHPETRIQ